VVIEKILSQLNEKAPSAEASLLPESRALPGRLEDWRGNPLGEPLSVSGISSFVPV